MSDIDVHTVLAQDNMSDGPAQNFEYWMGQAPLPGAVAGATTVRTTAASAAINTTETLLIRIPLVLPNAITAAAGTLNVGSRIEAVLHGTNTSTVANASTFTIRAGILGTVADASVATAAVTSAATGTGIAFEVRIGFTVETLSATGTAFGSMSVMNTGVTGLAAVTNTVVPFTSSTLATTTATWLDLTYLSAAITTTSTFQDCTLTVYP
jgi:hypothetical protein